MTAPAGQPVPPAAPAGVVSQPMPWPWAPMRHGALPTAPGRAGW